MSSEKSLYKRVVVPENKQPFTPPLSKTYRGVSTISGGSTALYDLALIKQDLVNHFHIRQGERLENPAFGTIIWDMLFDPLTDELKNLIVEDVTQIMNYDPRVRIQNIVVSTYESGIQVECELFYLPYSIVEKLKFQFDKENSILN
jgi:phage baseplate assembly protein W